MKRIGIIMNLGLLALSLSLFAQGKPELKLDISERKVNMSPDERSGKAKIVYSPGDTVEYKILAKNVGTGVMVQPEIVDPIPEGVKYVIDSAKGQNCRIVFSINRGMAYSVWPVMVTATNANGVKIERPARMDEVTHIKWIVKEKLPAGRQKELSFRVVVE
jgi:uncharacterized repeat protein (TIGR01451 family)